MLKLYHHPKCSASRAAKALLEERGCDFVWVEYMKVPPTKAQLQRLAKKMGDKARGALLRRKEVLAKELGLLDAPLATIIEAIAAHPVLLNRPIVESDTGAVAARPPEKLLSLL